jgi:hypothetical protein
MEDCQGVGVEPIRPNSVRSEKAVCNRNEAGVRGGGLVQLFLNPRADVVEQDRTEADAELGHV